MPRSLLTRRGARSVRLEGATLPAFLCFVAAGILVYCEGKAT